MSGRNSLAARSLMKWPRGPVMSDTLSARTDIAIAHPSTQLLVALLVLTISTNHRLLFAPGMKRRVLFKRHSHALTGAINT